MELKEITFCGVGILEGADGSGMMGSGDKLLEAVGASVTRSLS